MTLARPPVTWAQAATKVAGMIGWPEFARIVRRSPRGVRYWGQPNFRTVPTVDQALLLDAAYRQAGGADSPFLDTFAALLDVKIARDNACLTELANDSAAFIREAGDLGAALFQATRPGATTRDHNRALVEAQQVETALGAIMRRLPSFLQFGTGSHSGNTGGAQ